MGNLPGKKIRETIEDEPRTVKMLPPDTSVNFFLELEKFFLDHGWSMEQINPESIMYCDYQPIWDGKDEPSILRNPTIMEYNLEIRAKGFCKRVN